MPTPKAPVFLLLVLASRAALAQTDRSTCETPVPVALGASRAVVVARSASDAEDDGQPSNPSFGRTLSELLTGSIPGVSVLRSSGIAGTGSRVHLRGVGGLLAPQQPLLFIDGIRAEGELQSMLLDAGGQAPSRLDDLSVDDITCVQVLRGPATTARYGTDAAAGIIYVVTRRPIADSARARFFVEGGATNDAHDYPANFGTESLSPFGGCTRADAALGRCSPGPVRSWSPLERDSPFRSAPLVNAGGDAAVVRGQRGSLGVRGRGTVADGPFRRNTSRGYSAGVAAELRLAPQVRMEGDLWVSGGYSSLPQTGGSTVSILYAGLFGTSADTPERGYRSLPLSVLEEFGTEQRVRRIGGVTRLRWTPGPWLAVVVSGGREDSRTRDEQSDPTFRFSTLPKIDPPAFLATAEQRGQRTTVTASATSTYGPRAARLTTEVGFDYLDETQRRVTRTVDTTPQQQESSYSYRPNDPSITGLLVRQAVSTFDRLFVEGGVRRDHIHWRPVDLHDATYPFGSAAWHVLRRSSSPERRGRPSLLIRAAYGESGDRRPFDAALDLTGILPVTPVSPQELAPVRRLERTSETEAGFDVGILGDRATISATYFSKRTADGLMPGAVFGSSGAFRIITTGASWKNTGTEIAVRTPVVHTRAVSAEITLTHTTLQNEVVSLGGFEFSSSLSSRTLPGYPISGFWNRRYWYTDANSDGVLVPAEVVADTGLRYLGSPIPTRELGVAPSLTLGRSVTVKALIDYRGGFRSVNLTGRQQCVSACAALYVPNASLADQARAVDEFDASAGWIEDASFVKVRELVVSWTLPASWSRRASVRAARLVLMGRNLATLTDYTGLDPEVSAAGQSRLDQRDLFTPTVPRTVTLRADVTW